MTRRPMAEDRITRWFEEEGLGEPPDRVLEETFTRTRSLPQQRPARGARVPFLRGRAPLLVAAGLVLAGAAMAAVGSPSLLRGALPEPALARNGLIAYSAGGVIWLVGADGATPRPLTGDPSVNSSPVWSPDGTRIAYLGSAFDVVVSDLEGVSRKVVATGIDGMGWRLQVWSPDGTRLVFSKTTAAGPRIFIAPVDGSGPVQVGDPALDARAPAWSPDGKLIAFDGGRPIGPPFVSAPASDRGVYVMAPDGSGVRRLSQVEIDTEWTHQQLSWSPDSTRIAGHAGSETDFDIYVFEADGSGETRITREPFPEFLPTWSPDGARIAFLHNAPAPYGAVPHTQVVIVDADGSRPSAFDVPPYVGSMEPIWSPDGRRILYHADPGLAIADPTGQEPTVTISAAGAGLASWQRLPP